MKRINGLSLNTHEDFQLGVDTHDDAAYFDLEGAFFSASFVLPRRQCREMRDWLNAFLDD